MKMHLTAALLGVLVAAPAGGDEGFTAKDVARLRMVTAIEMAPDGRHVAYVLSVPRRPFAEDSGPMRGELYVVDLDGNSRPYVAGEADVSALAWKPDGSGIAFLEKREGDKFKCVYFIPLDGGEARKIVEHDADIADFDWSPDGREIAFTAKDKESKDQKKLKEKGFDQQVYEEKFEPNRVWVNTLAEDDAWDDAEPAEPKRFEVKGHPTTIAWSPSGKHLAVAVAPTPLVDDSYMKKKIQVIDAADGAQVGVVENPGKLGPFRFSPDGEHLALVAGADVHDPNPGRLMVAPVAGGKPVDVLPELADGDATDVEWRTDNQLVYLADKGVASSLAVVDRDGEHEHAVIPFGKHALAAVSLSDDGNRAALLIHGPQHPLEVFTIAVGESEPRRLTNSNPWLDKVKLAKQEVVAYKARDGLELEGLLIRPKDEEPGKRYPLVLMVHGGPEAHFQNGWITRYAEPGQLMAAHGFAVFYPNYRGSTGRGVEFSKKGQADAAGTEFDDLVDAVDHLVAAGLVDKNKVGVTGGSYGGFASAWCATRLTDRFAASVMFVGISDLVSKFGTTDIPNEEFLVHARKYPWDDWAFSRERSPLTYAPQARTPILILHGKDDPRVHPSQSLELYRYLKTLGKVPVRLVLYPGEGHGNRKSAARMDYSLRLLQWMQHYLQGPGGDPPAADLDYTDVKPKEDPKEDDEKKGGDDAAKE